MLAQLYPSGHRIRSASIVGVLYHAVLGIGIGWVAYGVVTWFISIFKKAVIMYSYVFFALRAGKPQLAG